jgi:hypothetical protein
MRYLYIDAKIHAFIAKSLLQLGRIGIAKMLRPRRYTGTNGGGVRALGYSPHFLDFFWREMDIQRAEVLVKVLNKTIRTRTDKMRTRNVP